MDIIEYDEKYVPDGQGFINIGSTCYFNSILQCLLSCPSIYKTLDAIREKKHVKINKLAQNFIDLWDSALKNEDISQKCFPVWNYIIAISRSQNNKIRMDSGQQDAHEGLMMFLDAVESIPEIRRLFEHRYRIQAFCDLCKECVIDRKETGLVFEVQPDLKTEQLDKFKEIDEYGNTSMPLNEFLVRQNGYIDGNHICEKCNQRSEKYKTTTLCMIPEILAVTFKKYTNKMNTPFPATLKFISKGASKQLVYKLVAQTEHYGSMSSGHYIAICKRSSGWKEISDNSVSDGQAGPTTNTYIVFYHYMGEELIQ